MTVSLNLTASIIGLIVVSVTCDYWARVRRMRGSKLPPGLPKLPLLGNIHNFPMGDAWFAYKDISRELDSSIIHFDVMGTDVIVLHDLKSIGDLMERRSSLYSCRPQSVMIGELMSWSQNPAMLPYGNAWRATRRALHQEFKPLIVKNYQAGQIAATQELLRRLVESPEHWQEHMKHLTAGVVLDNIYGLDIAPKNDPYVEVVEKALAGATVAMRAGAYMVDAIPWLKYVPAWVPGAGFQTEAKQWKALYRTSVHGTYAAFKNALAKDSTRSSFCSRQLARLDPTHDNSKQESVIEEIGAGVYAAGVETTSSVLGTFILAMVMHPDVLAKAQSEIDTVIGLERLPTFGEEQSLPYLMAIIKECLRWHPVTPIGVPHRLVADDYYNGYFMPAGSIVIANTWAIMHDEKAYPEPFSFNPERFMKDGQLDPTVQDPRMAAFGYGRRICPGRHFAMGTIWITLASILSAFNIAKAVDAEGRPITPSGRYTGAMTNHVDNFICAITPRSERMKDVILSSAK
ncbi:cytochrome P450 [Athelia psychrophila]|uniref:Cytochrome P450 n=1 Tax=Athelia psychrophila TaxID=1759441 RepID=A0A166SSY1_9AGAM|nr:cytochrome P450 [Fibularhizoctonia sp. CBS 109695]